MGPYVPEGDNEKGVDGYIGGGDCTACKGLYEGTGTCIIDGAEYNGTYEHCQEYSGTCSSPNGCGQCKQYNQKSACVGSTDCIATGGICVWSQGGYTPKYCYPKGQPCDIDKNISCCNSECKVYYEKAESFCG